MASSAASRVSTGFIQGEELVVGVGGWRVRQIDLLTASAVAKTLLSPGFFDENPPHGLGRSSKEMPAALPAVVVGRADQADVRLINPGGGKTP